MSGRFAMSDAPIVYLDSCFFVTLFNREKGRVEVCRRVLEAVKDGKANAVISTAVIAETRNPPHAKKDAGELFYQSFLKKISLDLGIAQKTRAILSKVSGIKGLDAVHLATALDEQARWFFTFDDKLLNKNGHPELASLEIVVPSTPWNKQPTLPGLSDLGSE